MLGYKKGNTKLLAGQVPKHYPADRVYLDGDTTKSVQDKVARKADLTKLDLTGTTNTTGLTIAVRTFFYLNGVLVRAKTDIANGATFTLNTNYEIPTDGGLNRLLSDINGKCDKTWANKGFTKSSTQTEVTSFDTTKVSEVMLSLEDASHRVFGSTVMPINIAINGQAHVMQYQDLATAYFYYVNNKPYAWVANSTSSDKYASIYVR